MIYVLMPTIILLGTLRHNWNCTACNLLKNVLYSLLNATLLIKKEQYLVSFAYNDFHDMVACRSCKFCLVRCSLWCLYFVLWLCHLVNIIGSPPTCLFLKRKCLVTTVIVARKLRTDCIFLKFALLEFNMTP